jgi:rubrerythrin
MTSTSITGALARETTDGPVNRRDALLRTGRLAGAVAIASMPLTLGLFARKAAAQGSIAPELLDVLNYALTLERLEDEFYRQALATGGLDLGDARPAIEQISKHETAHVALLTGLLGEAATPAPTYDFTGGGQFGNPFSSATTFFTLAQAFEDAGVRAYKDQAPLLISQDQLLTTALRIHSVEARHAAMIRRLSQSPADSPWITGSSNSAAAIQPIYDGEEATTQLGIDLAPFGSADAVSQAFDEPLARETVEAFITPFIIPAEEPPPV